MCFSQWNHWSKLMLRYQLSTGSRALQQTQLFNYLYSNINFSSNKTLCARTDQQKCILPARSNTLHYSVVAMWYSLNKAPYSQQIARTTSYWLSIIQISKENGLFQLMWCIFFLFALCLALELWWAKEETDILPLIASDYVSVPNLSTLL